MARKLFTLSREDDDIDFEAGETLDVEEVIEGESALTELNDGENEINSDLAVIDSSEEIVEEGEARIEENEEILENDDADSTDAEVAAVVTTESFKMHMRAVGMPEGYYFRNMSRESAGSNPMSALRLSTEDAKSVISEVIESIKRVAAQIVVKIKETVAKAAVWLNQNESKAKSMLDKLKETKGKVKLEPESAGSIADKFCYWILDRGDSTKGIKDAVKFINDSANAGQNKILTSYLSSLLKMKIGNDGSKLEDAFATQVQGKKFLGIRTGWAKIKGGFVSDINSMARNIASGTGEELKIDGTFLNNFTIGDSETTTKLKSFNGAVIRADGTSVGFVSVDDVDGALPVYRYWTAHVKQASMSKAKSNVKLEPSLGDLRDILENVKTAASKLSSYTQTVYKDNDSVTDTISAKLKQIQDVSSKIDKDANSTDEDKKGISDIAVMFSSAGRKLTTANSAIAFNKVFGYIRTMQNALSVVGMYVKTIKE